MPQRQLSESAFRQGADNRARLKAQFSKPGMVHVFISYTGSDQAVREELIDVDRERVECFQGLRALNQAKIGGEILMPPWTGPTG
jgi:hypothetical protein